MKIFIKVLLVTSCFCVALFAKDEITPIGKWKTIDDKTHEVTSIVALWIDDQGQLRGKVDKVIPKTGEDPNPVCKKCKYENKDKPINGMEILWGFKRAKSDDSARWINGKILDPDEGETYNCILTMDATGKSLEVRGYIGIPLLGRSQTWIRVD